MSLQGMILNIILPKKAFEEKYHVGSVTKKEKLKKIQLSNDMTLYHTSLSSIL